MQFFMPTELITGEHCVAENAKKLARYGKRCLIVTGGSAATRSGALQDALPPVRKEADWPMKRVRNLCLESEAALHWTQRRPSVFSRRIPG